MELHTTWNGIIYYMKWDWLIDELIQVFFKYFSLTVQANQFLSVDKHGGLSPWNRVQLAMSLRRCHRNVCSRCHDSLASVRDSWFPTAMPLIPDNQILLRAVKRFGFSGEQGRLRKLNINLNENIGFSYQWYKY